MMNVTIWHLLLLLVNMALIACCVIGNSKHYSTKRENTSEQLTIRSSSGIRLSVDTAMISYEHFYEMILQNVPESRRSGW